MADQTFTVTLPSNSNMSSDSTNCGSKYTVRLAEPLNFDGQMTYDDVSWDVALTSIQYTNRFYSVREAVVFHVVVEFPNISAVEIHTPSVKGVTQYSENLNMNNLRGYEKLYQRMLKQFVRTVETADHTFVASAKIHIPAAHYSGPSAVYAIIVDEFNKLFSGGRYITTMRAVTTPASGVIQLQLEPSTNKLHMYTDNLSIANILGMTARVLDTETPTLYHISGTSTKTPCFDVAQSLYVYSDIIKPQHVGNTLAPLLEIVPVQGVPGQRMHYSFGQLTYLPVNRTYIDSISIEIRDEYGNYVAFSDDVENVICRLRFRRSKNGALVWA